MPSLLLSLFAILLATATVFGQESSLPTMIDSLVMAKAAKPFNGVILISQNGKTVYAKKQGFSDREKQIPLTFDDQFVIGSISKQITAVLILREYEKGHVALHTPIHTYLPELPEKWADSVTVHQLLTHTHGIIALNKPLAFRPGSRFAYSQIGYELLATIAAKTSRQSFAQLSGELFRQCAMKSTFHPDVKEYKKLVKGYTEQPDGSLSFETQSLENYAAAGSFISTARDLVRWNTYLHNGKLLADSTFRLMTTIYSTRQHPIFGSVDYGYGITVSTTDSLVQLGQTGLAPGFVSMNFYYPATGTSVIMLENIVWTPEDIKKTFFYHTQMLHIVRKSLQHTATETGETSPK